NAAGAGAQTGRPAAEPGWRAGAGARLGKRAGRVHGRGGAGARRRTPRLPAATARRAPDGSQDRARARAPRRRALRRVRVGAIRAVGAGARPEARKHDTGAARGRWLTRRGRGLRVRRADLEWVGTEPVERPEPQNLW